MADDLFYLDEGQVKITAASVGVSKARWTDILASEITSHNYKEVMEQNRFDVLPIVNEDGSVTDFFITETINHYDESYKETILNEDTIPSVTPIREVISRFAKDNRTFYFLTRNTSVTGLITVGNLNCRQVQIYIFGLLCELERSLGNFINQNINNERLAEYMVSKSASNSKLNEIWKHYQELVRNDLENRLTEHLFLIDFFDIVKHFDLNTKLNYSKTKWSEMSGINELRHLICHPTRSLLNNENDIGRLEKRISKIETLILQLNTLK